MFFALADYQNYIRRTGRFARDVTKSIMGGAFEGAVSDKALDLLQPGDVLFVQTLEWPLAWLIMYLTRSEVSHCAFYIGNAQIAHATLAGVSIDPIESLYGPNTRILPCIWPMSDEKRHAVVRIVKEQYQGVPYGWIPVIVKGIRILTGRDWPYFRWSFFADVVVILLLLDLPFLLVLCHPVITWLIPVYFALVAFNSLLWRFCPLTFNEWTGKPIDLLNMLQRIGGSFLFDAFAVRQQVTAPSAVGASTHGRETWP